MNSYDLTHESVTRQLQDIVRDNWLTRLFTENPRDRMAGQDILSGDTGQLRKDIERGKVSQEKVIALAREAYNLGLIPNSRVQLIQTRIN